MYHLTLTEISYLKPRLAYRVAGFEAALDYIEAKAIATVYIRCYLVFETVYKKTL